MDDVSMKYKIGEPVRVKSYEKIQKTLDGGNHLKGEIIFFNAEMKKYCDRVYKVLSYSSFGHYYNLKNCEMEPGNCWQWPEDWLEPVNRFKKGNFVVVNPNLIPGKIYGHEVFIEDMIPTRGTMVEITTVDSTMGLYHIKENHWNYTDEMFLTLDEAFIPGRRVCYKNGKRFPSGSEVATIKEVTSDSEVLFTETSICEPLNGLVILPEVNSPTEKLTATPFTLSIKDGITYEEWFNPIKIQNNENQLQGKKTRVRRAEVPEGRRIRSRKSKASVVIGHLSNQARVGY